MIIKELDTLKPKIRIADNKCHRIGSLKKSRNQFHATIAQSLLFVGYDCYSVYDVVELRVYFKCWGFSQLAKN